MKNLLVVVGVLMSLVSNAQSGHYHERAIEFPNVGAYLTLTTDLHQHTVFSDGSVWPTIRVEEALRDSLDAISITDHLEYQPHKDDIPNPDRNRSNELAIKASKDKGLIVIRGSEITRSMPPGHSNAIFIKDANQLLIDDPMKVFVEANKQGAFVFWNHPNWLGQSSNGIANLSSFHQELVEKKLLHGIEVVNDLTYSEEALQIALDHNLTIMGTSDIHDLVDWQYNVPEGGHRPVTLVFSKEKTEEGIKEGLFSGRTAVWFDHYLIGKEEYLTPLVEACIKVQSAGYIGKTSVLRVEIKNTSDADFILENQSSYTFNTNGGVVFLKPHTTLVLEVKTKSTLTSINLPFTVLNAITAPGKNAVLNLMATP